MMRRTLLVFAIVVLAVGALAGGAMLATAQTDADLTILQPDYVSGDVEVEDTDGERIYRVEGGQQHIYLDSADHDDVTSFGVSDGGGSLEHDERSDQFVFEPDGDGTSTVYWQVQERDGNETQSVRYEAVIQAENTDWVHRTADRDEEIQSEAEMFREIEGEVERLAPDEDVDDVISAALTMYQFFDSPFSTLVNDMRAILIMLALRPGGWIIGGFLLFVALLGVASGARYRNRTQKQFADIGDIELEKTEAYLQKAKRILSNTDYNEFLPDDAARAMRDTLGRNPWIGFKNYLLLRSPTHVKGVVLQMMAHIGYVGRLRRTANGEIDEAWVEQPDGGIDDGVRLADGGDAVETVDLSELAYESEADRAFINSISGEELDLGVFAADVPPEAVDFPISNRQTDEADLIDELNPHFPDDFEDEQHLARALGELVEYVVNHPHTDAWGRAHRELDLLSFLAEMDNVLADEADFPVAHVQRRMLIYIADNMDKSDEIIETVDRLDEDGVV